MVYGGQAGLNSVVFYNKNNKVKAVRGKNGQISVEIIPRDSRKITEFGSLLDKVPIIRGMWLIVELLLINWKIHAFNFVLLFALLQSQKILTTETPGSFISNTLYAISTPPLQFFLLLGIFLCVSLFSKLTEVGKYHSAEHMVDNAYKDSQDISLQNVQRYSRVHLHCGSNIVMFIFICYFPIYYLIDNIFIASFLSFVLGYELHKIKGVWLKKALTPLYVSIYFLQWILFTSKPDSKHLEVSIAAYQEIIKLSTINSDV